MVKPKLCCECRPIPINTAYYATRCGKIWSTKTSKFMVGSVGKGKFAYHNVGFLVNGKPKTLRSHRLIADAFGFLNRSPGMVINHINGIKTDNRVDNLECVTVSQNAQHSFDIGLQKKFLGDKSHRSKLTETQAREILKKYKLISYGKSNAKALAEEYGVSKNAINDLLCGDTWPHLQTKAKDEV